MVHIARNSIAEARNIASVAKRCVLFLIVVAAAATNNGGIAGSSSGIFASATGPGDATCKDKKVKIKINAKKVDYCGWVGEAPDVRCLDKRHKGRMRKYKVVKESGEVVTRRKRIWLKPLKKCTCVCDNYIDTIKTDDDGCPVLTQSQIDSGYNPDSDLECVQPLKECVYNHVYSGCTFEELQCVVSYVCDCFDSSWTCFQIDNFPSCETDPVTRAPRSLDDYDRLLREDGLPNQGDTCNPDDPLPKPTKPGENPWGPGGEDGISLPDNSGGRPEGDPCDRLLRGRGLGEGCAEEETVDGDEQLSI
eukprot:jgi/Psemu1/283658/fgenesh1_pg.31_\